MSNKFLNDVSQAMKNNEATIQMLEVINKKINYLKEQNDENLEQAFSNYDSIADIADSISSEIDYTRNICLDVRSNLEDTGKRLVDGNSVIKKLLVVVIILILGLSGAAFWLFKYGNILPKYNQIAAEQEMNEFRESGKAFIFSENIITNINDLVNDINMTRSKKNVMIKYVTNTGEYDLRWLDNNQTTDFITSNWSPDFNHRISKKISIVPFDIGTWGAVMMLKGDILVEYFDLR